MKSRRFYKGIILRRGMTIISLFLLFFTISAVDFGIEKIQAEKAFSEYSKDSFVIISKDLTKLFVVKKESTDQDIRASYWDIEGKEDPVLIWKKYVLPSYSPKKVFIRGNALHLQNKNTVENISTGNVYTHSYYARIKGNAVHINKMGFPDFVNKIELPDLFASGKWEAEIEISNDNSKIAVFMRYDGLEQEYRNKNYFYLYDIKSGEKIDEIKVFGYSDSNTNLPHWIEGFSFDDRYITIRHSQISALYTNIYSLEKGRYVFNDEITYGSGGLKDYFFLKEKDLLMIRDKPKKYIEIIDLTKGEVIKSFNYYNIDGIPRMETDFLGSTYDGTTFNELIVMGDQLLKYKTHQIEDEKIATVAYNKDKKEWVIVGQNKVHYIPSKASEARPAIEQYEEGREMLEYGFDKGVEKIKGALAKGLFTGLAHNSGRFLKDYDLTLKQRAELVLAEYKSLMAGDMTDNYDLLYAHRKLFEYGLLAARAGYPQFTLQAAEQIRKLELMYPDGLLWDKVENHIILLEGLGIAVRDGSEAGYNYMLDNDGILNDDDNKNYILNVYLNDYAEYFAPLLTDKKKMSYFTKIAENELPSAQMWQLEKVDFVDLEGNEITGVEAMQGDGAAGESNSGKTNDSGSGDSNNSDSAPVGTILD